jgi:hypothetical protein
MRGAVKKFPEFFAIDGLVQHEFVPPGQSVAVQVLQRKRRDKWQAGAVVLHRATHRLLCHHPTTALSGSRSEWLLAVPCSENGPQGDIIL